LTIGSEDYRRAALARLGDARSLYDGGQWSGATYVAGRGVEAVLRALILKRSDRIESGHDLKHHLKSARRLGLLTDDEARGGGRINDALNELAIVWQNNRRYFDDKKLMSVLKQVVVFRRMKGDILKECARRVLEAAELLINRGDRAWIR